jgi:ribosomal protein L32
MAAINAPNKRHQKRAHWALDSQQVARVCGGRYVF